MCTVDLFRRLQISYTDYSAIESIHWGSQENCRGAKVSQHYLPTLNSSQHSSRQSVEEGGLEPCAICLEDYKQGDEVCWSRNRHCAHVFHQKCIVEWLLHHEGCPVCRQDYLSLENSDNAETELHESVEQTFTEETEDSLADEVHPPTGDIKDRSVDEVPRDP
jgi:hypothetical protein